MPENENFLKGISVKIGNDKYVLPIKSVKQSFKVKKENVITYPNGNEIIKTHEGVYCLLRANDIFDIEPKTNIEDGIVIAIENKGKRICLLVDELVGQIDVNVLMLPECFKEVNYIDGCAFTNDAELVLVVNVPDLFSSVDVGLWNSEATYDSEEIACNDVEEADLHNKDTTKDKFLSFIINNETYCVAVSAVNEIISLCNVRKVPNAPSVTEGIISLRGKIIPVISVRKRFLMDSIEDSISTCIVVVENNDTLTGIKVDKVGEVLFIEESARQSPPSASRRNSNQYIHSIGRIDDRVIQMLDLEKLLLND